MEVKPPPLLLRFGRHLFQRFALLLLAGAALAFIGERFSPGEGMAMIGFALAGVVGAPPLAWLGPLPFAVAMLAFAELRNWRARQMGADWREPIPALSSGQWAGILRLLAIQAQGCRWFGTESFQGDRFSAMGALLVSSGIQAIKREFDLAQEVRAIITDPFFDKIAGGADGLFFQVVPGIARLQFGEGAMRVRLRRNLFPLLKQSSAKPLDFLLFHSCRH